VTGQVRRDEVGEVAHRRQRALDRIALEHQRHAGLAGERLLPGRPPGVALQDLRRVLGEQLGDRRVERAARALADDPRGVPGAAQPVLERRVAGHVHDANGERDLLTLRSARPALAVPALGEAREQRLHRRGESQPLGQHLPDLADRGEMTGTAPDDRGEALHDIGGANRRGAPGRRERRASGHA
jgi:hypothetical protein